MECCGGYVKSQGPWTRRFLSVVLTVMLMLVVGKSLFLNGRYGAMSSSRRILTDESMKSLESICNVTLYSDQCYSTLLSVNSNNPRVLFRASLVTTVEEYVKILKVSSKLVSSNDTVMSSLKVCNDMIVDSLEYLNETIERYDGFGEVITQAEIDEIRGKLSYVIIDHDTCFDGFDEIMEYDLSSYTRNEEIIKKLKATMKNGRELVSISLAIVTKVLGGLTKKNLETESGVPVWFGNENWNSILNCNMIPNVTVAKDGSGTYQTISEAIASVPDKSSSRYVIHVTEGIYNENVNVPKYKYNIVMYGDGMTKTVVSGKFNRFDTPNISTWETATFSVSGKWFIGMDMKFVNTAGKEKKQAVAFHSRSDQSVMYRCAFEGNQDTLYTHAGEQLYRDCDIVGTIDFICGYAAAMFQNCTIRPRKTLLNETNVVTAQAADVEDMISGFSIIDSKIYSFDKENIMTNTYLGRPWRKYATVVVMKTLIEHLIHPKGWMPWNNMVNPPTTITFGEYMNYGPGSSVGNRVNWIGYKRNMTNTEARNYTVNVFINKQGWLNQTCIPYNCSISS